MSLIPQSHYLEGILRGLGRGGVCLPARPRRPGPLPYPVARASPGAPKRRPQRVRTHLGTQCSGEPPGAPRSGARRGVRGSGRWAWSASRGAASCSAAVQPLGPRPGVCPALWAAARVRGRGRVLCFFAWHHGENRGTASSPRVSDDFVKLSVSRPWAP